MTPDSQLPDTDAMDIELTQMPGHLIRRLQQIAVAAFLQEVEPFGVTPVQFAALQAVAAHPRVDQRTLSGLVGLDTSTIAGVVDRLEARDLLQRLANPQDRRMRLLDLTDAGHALLAGVTPAMLRAQQRILQPLKPAERKAFLRMLQVLVSANNTLSRAPTQG